MNRVCCVWAIFSLVYASIIPLLAGCTAFLPKRAAPPEGELPEQFSQGDADDVRSMPWWHDFGSEPLNELIHEAMQENLTLRQLWARLDQAGAVATQAASGLYPQLDYGGNAGYRRTSVHVDVVKPTIGSQLRDATASGIANGLNNVIQQRLNGSGGGSGSGSGVSTGTGLSSNKTKERVVTETRQFDLSLAATYEVDLWGRIFTQYRAAEFEVNATREDLEATAITLAAEVTDRWLRILEQQELRRILNEQLETNNTYLDLVELRFRNGLVSALDVYQQRQVVSEVRRQIPLVEASEQVLRQDLAVLLGRLPTTAVEVGAYDLAEVPPLPPTGIPAELLIHRPDIRAALSRLQAADYRVASARAERLPALRLTGGIGYNTGQIRHLFDDWFLSIAAGLAGPLFDGFRREAEVERTRAVVEERLAEYRLVVLTAIQEVEASLVEENRQREYMTALSEQRHNAQDALREASERYRRGLTDYLPVLSALERTQALTRMVVNSRRELLTIRLNLYRALGGTWTQELQAPIRLSEQDVAEKDSAL
ncbi:MAG: TolC family protein [Phycisphaerales bacterium]|nr:TolC family protein [Phycisphaerales bacterium]